MRISRVKLGILAVFLGVIVLAGCGGGGGEPAVDTASVAEGHELFKRSCATCHGPNGEGMPALGKNLNANEFIQTNSNAELVEFMKLGRPATHPDNTRGVDMPPKGGNPMLTDEDLEKIAVYVKSLQ